MKIKKQPPPHRLTLVFPVTKDVRPDPVPIHRTPQEDVTRARTEEVEMPPRLQVHVRASAREVVLAPRVGMPEGVAPLPLPMTNPGRRRRRRHRARAARRRMDVGIAMDPMRLVEHPDRIAYLPRVGVPHRFRHALAEVRVCRDDVRIGRRGVQCADHLPRLDGDRPVGRVRIGEAGSDVVEGRERPPPPSLDHAEVAEGQDQDSPPSSSTVAVGAPPPVAAAAAVVRRSRRGRTEEVVDDVRLVRVMRDAARDGEADGGAADSEGPDREPTRPGGEEERPPRDGAAPLHATAAAAVGDRRDYSRCSRGSRIARGGRWWWGRKSGGMLLLRSHRRRGLDAVDANGRPADGGAAAFADDVSPVLATIVVRVQLTGRRGILLVHLVFKPIAAPLLKPFTDSPSSSLGQAAVEDNRCCSLREFPQKGIKTYSARSFELPKRIFFCVAVKAGEFPLADTHYLLYSGTGLLLRHSIIFLCRIHIDFHHTMTTPTAKPKK